jgi:hypothetical protein
MAEGEVMPSEGENPDALLALIAELRALRAANATLNEALTDALSAWHMSLLHGRLIHDCEHTENSEREAIEVAVRALAAMSEKLS